jgi:aryl-alcohol dehydrogenase-like predicted oxidoreductase
MPRIGHSDLDVFPLALGGNTFGWTSDAATSHAVLDGFVAGGGDFIDTADVYSAWVPGNSGGESETILGEWFASRGNRSDVVLATKVSQHPEFAGLSAKTVAAASEASLKRLQTDHIDLYYAHFDDADTPLEETVAAFDALVTAGTVRYVGISNYSAERIAEWLAIADAHGFARPVAFQPHYNLVHRTEYESALAPIAAAEGLGVVPYSALASGFLTGKYRTEADLDGAARGGSVGGYLTEQGLAVVEVLADVASAHSVSIATTALAWLASRQNVVAPIASARTLEQLPNLLAVATTTLTTEDLARLDEVSAHIAA